MNLAELLRAPKPVLPMLAILVFVLNFGNVSAQGPFPKAGAKAMPIGDVSALSRAKPSGPQPSVFGAMLAAKSNNITITTDLNALIEGKKKSDYQPGEIVFGKKQVQPIQLRPRGKFRRKICEFPPLKIKFSKKELAAAGFSDLNEIKLVTHCANSDAGDQLLARELLPYLMYAELTPISHRARLVDVTYIDSKDVHKKIKRLGILLEDDEELAARLGGGVTDTLYNLPIDSMNAHLVALNALFEYMIGNTDWSIEAVRNIKFLRGEAGSKMCPVPYDFDFSGFVNASYASPNSEFPIKTVRERYFQGASLPPDVVRRAAPSFHKNELKFHDIITMAAVIDELEKEDLHAYIDSFFKILKDSKDVPVNKPRVADR